MKPLDIETAAYVLDSLPCNVTLHIHVCSLIHFVMLYMYKNEKAFNKNERRSRDAAAKKELIQVE